MYLYTKLMVDYLNMLAYTHQQALLSETCHITASRCDFLRRGDWTGRGGPDTASSVAYAALGSSTVDMPPISWSSGLGFKCCMQPEGICRILMCLVG